MALHSYKPGEFGDNLVEKQRNGYSGSEFLDSRWSGVGAHMGDHELEEGEACDEPDLSCDPDTDFSYLDEKIVMVLGDVQKCFEGGVSAEKLGSKFGGYGSFLPTQERAPSILHQDKPASAVASDAYCRTKKSSSEGIVERVKRNATGSSIQASSLKAGSSSAVLTHENGGRDLGPVKEKFSNVDSSFPAGRIEENTSIPKKVTLRIKMGSDTNEKRKNAAIYSDFGLSNSSSEAEDEFMDEDRRTDSDPESSPDRTPLTMIRVMTSHHIPDGMLLSPLPDLITESFMHKERVWSTCQEDLIEKTRSPGLKNVGLFKDGDTFDKVEIPREKTREHAGERKGDSAMSSERAPKRVKIDKDRGSSKDSSRHASKPPSKAYGKDLSKVNEVEKQARDAVSESGTGVRSHDSLKDYKGFSLDRAPLDYPLYEADHIPKDFCSPFQPQKEVDSGRELQLRGYRAEKVASSSHDSANEHLDVGHQGRDAGKEVFNTLETNLHGKKHPDVSSKPVDGKRRSSAKGFLVPGEGKTLSQEGRLSTSKGIGAGRTMIPATDVSGRELAERPTECGQEADVSRGSSKEKGKDSLKEVHRSSVKDKYLKTSSAADSVADETPKDGPLYPSKTASQKDYKEFQQIDLPKLPKTEVEHKRKEKTKERVTSGHINKETSKVSEERQRELATRDVPMKVSQPAFVPEAVSIDKPSQSGTLPPPPAENAPPPYILVMDNWVQCDKCEKWRLLPPGVEDANLPQKWRCKMLYWLEKEGLNKCSFPEETTDQATRAIFNIAAPLQPPVQENPPPAVAPVQPPASAVTSLTLPSAITSQETKAPEKIKGTFNKKRKIPPTASSETIVPGKSKSFAEPLQATQDGSQGKLGGGDTITTQEKVQAKVGGPDLGPVKTGEEKQKGKEREKARRPRPSDGGSGSSPSGKKHSQTPGNLALREATDLKHKANSIQGQERAGTALFFQAALKFLQAASMLESEGAHGAHLIKLFADTARLCDYCASNYDHNKDLAAAALAYKCAGVARMRVVQAKSSLISKCRAEVQSARQVAPGESPISSMPVDTDVSRNSAIDRKLTRGAASPASNAHSGGSLIIAAKCRSSFNQILEYVADTSTAVEALTKALNAFAAAESASACTVDGMSALRKVLDFSFHDLDSFVRLVRIALEAMGH